MMPPCPHRAAVLALSALPALRCTPDDALRCGGGEVAAPCHEVDGGRYLVLEPRLPPPGPLPAVLWFHGYGGSAVKQAAKDEFVQGLSDNGVLGILGDGLDNTWAHQGSPSSARDELAYVDAVLDDALSRYDIDEDKLWVAGFSQGGSMAWDAACYRAERFAAAFPASGAFWEPLPASCPSGPLRFRHTHGLQDTTVPMEGRPIGSWRQGDVLEGMDVRLSANGCAAEPDRVEVDGPSTCQIWDACDSGRDVALCLYEGGHKVPDGWLNRNLAWVGHR